MGASLARWIRSVCLSPFSRCRLSPVVCRATGEYVAPTRACCGGSENEKAWNGAGKAFDKHNFRPGARRARCFYYFRARTSFALPVSPREDTLTFTLHCLLLYTRFYHQRQFLRVNKAFRRTFQSIPLLHTQSSGIYVNRIVTLQVLQEIAKSQSNVRRKIIYLRLMNLLRRCDKTN